MTAILFYVCGRVRHFLKKYTLVRSALEKQNRSRFLNRQVLKLERWLSRWRTLTVLQGTWVQFPACMWELLISVTPVPGSDSHFWSLWSCVHKVCMQCMYMHAGRTLMKQGDREIKKRNGPENQGMTWLLTYWNVFHFIISKWQYLVVKRTQQLLNLHLGDNCQ